MPFCKPLVSYASLFSRLLWTPVFHPPGVPSTLFLTHSILPALQALGDARPTTQPLSERSEHVVYNSGGASVGSIIFLCCLNFLRLDLSS